MTDVQAGYDGDPAAYNTDEIILSYPGLYAIFVNRLAHELFLLGVPLIPRMMTEYAHGLPVLISIRCHDWRIFLHRPRYRRCSR